MDYNNQNNDIYNYEPMPENSNQYAGLALASMIVGICAFFINTLYIVSLVAVVLGIVALAKHTSKKGFAITGLICGGVSLMSQFIVDIILIPFTFGLSFFC